MREKSPLFSELRLRTLIYAAIILLLWGSCGQCCGPGRGGGRRRSPRKLTPLVFKQHVPNVAENTLGASGLTEGRISRDDPRFHDLVPNYNVDILFSDEEGTGADRLMTERCKEKLNTLAISVMNQWPGVRLRVVEAWDEGSLHAPNSLHYEGRAVDVATSDKDLSKHGMLARLAVQAGFDWVYYESRSRVHCSVKSESSSRRKLGGCFPGKAMVETPSGPVPIQSLHEGDEVKVLRSDGTLSYSPVLMFLHRDASSQRHFLSLTTSSGTVLNLTPSHLVFILRDELTSSVPTVFDALRAGEVVLAGRVCVGNYLLVTRNESDVVLEKVVDMNSVTEEGVYAPLTAEGTVVVDKVVASCYAVIDSQYLAHWAFLPVRLYYSLKSQILHILMSVGFISKQSIADNQNVNSNIIDNMNYNIIYNKNFNLIDKTNSNLIHNINSNIIDENSLSKKSLPNSKDILIGNRHNRLLIQNIKNIPFGNRYNQIPKSGTKAEVIHWYPKVLYSIASWILPSRLVYS